MAEPELAETTVAALQMLAEPKSISERIKDLDSLLGTAAQNGVRLAVLPEMALTGYALDGSTFRNAEAIPGFLTDSLHHLCLKHDLLAVGGLTEKSGSQYYNSQIVVGPDGLIGTYRKIHVASIETGFWKSGSQGKVVSTDIGKIGLGICADMSHPTPWRAYQRKADLIAISSAWPDFRSASFFPMGRWYRQAHWETIRSLPEKISRALGVPVIFSNACGPLALRLSPIGPTLRAQFAGHSRIVVDGSTVADDQEQSDEQIIQARLKPGTTHNPKFDRPDSDWTEPWIPEPRPLVRAVLTYDSIASGFLYRPLYALRSAMARQRTLP